MKLSEVQWHKRPDFPIDPDWIIEVSDEISMPIALARRDRKQGNGTQRIYRNQYTEDNRGVKVEYGFWKLTGLPMNLTAGRGGDGGVDFKLPNGETIDVKGTERLDRLALKETAVAQCADILVLAIVSGIVVQFVGWETRKTILACPLETMQPLGNRAHCLPIPLLLPLALLKKKDRPDIDRSSKQPYKLKKNDLSHLRTTGSERGSLGSR